MTASSSVDFLLGQLNCASLRTRLMTAEIDSISTALRGGFINSDSAMNWLHEAGGLDPDVVRNIVGIIIKKKERAMPRLRPHPEDRKAAEERDAPTSGKRKPPGQSPGHRQQRRSPHNRKKEEPWSKSPHRLPTGLRSGN